MTGVSFELCRPTEDHARAVMEWRNDPQTLAVSYHHEPKVWETFWPEFRDIYFSHPGLPPVFLLANGQRVGFLRFLPTAHPHGLGGRICDLAINLNPAFRGRGLAVPGLRLALEMLGRQGVDSVVAEVRVTNAVSLHAFRRAGFEEIGETDKTVADTGEVARIVRFVAELSGTYFRRRVTVIAEAGSNWRMGNRRRDAAMARALIDSAVEAGADVVKFQTYRPETVYAENAGQSEYLAEAGIKEDIRDIFADLAMPYEMIGDLADYCRRHGISFMSTGFSPSDFAAIDPFVEIHKLASYEISHLRLLELAGRSGKPLILSTGASTEEDIAWAVDTYRRAGGRELCLMQCTAKYPAPLSAMNLQVIPWLRRRFGVAPGLSDHSREPVLAPVMAVALGARVVEKHFTLDNRLPGPDHSFAVTAAELKALVAGVRQAEAVLGSGVKEVLSEEKELAAFARRGLQATRAIAAGDMLREGENFDILRPGKQRLGVHPKHIVDFEGRRARREIPVGEGLQPDDHD